MRILFSASILTLACAIALPSTACDRHGGMFGQLSGAGWTDFNPSTATSDALFLEEQLSEWHKQNPAPADAVKPAKPTFSKASSRAAFAAQARMAKRVTLSKQDKAKPKKANTASEIASR